jgi:hypothetical protein
MVVRGGEAMMVALHLVAVPVRAGLFVAGAGAKPAVPQSAPRKPSAKRCRRTQGICASRASTHDLVYAGLTLTSI